MAIDAFIQFEPAVKGESIAKGMEGMIDVMSWSWGMSQSGTTHMGTGGGSGKVSVQDLSFMKKVDASSPNIITKCCTGEHFEKCTLKLRKSGATPLEYLIIEFEEVLIASVSVGGGAGDDIITENVSINFARFHYKYKKQLKDGSGDAEIASKYDIAKNTQD